MALFAEYDIRRRTKRLGSGESTSVRNIDLLTSDNQLELPLEINRAIASKDADRLIQGVVSFMEQHRLRAHPDLAASVPTRPAFQVISSGQAK